MFADAKYVFTMGEPIFNSYEENAEHIINLLHDKHLYSLTYNRNTKYALEEEIERFNEVLNEKWKNNKKIVGVFSEYNYLLKLYIGGK